MCYDVVRQLGRSGLMWHRDLTDHDQEAGRSRSEGRSYEIRSPTTCARWFCRCRGSMKGRPRRVGYPSAHGHRTIRPALYRPRAHTALSGRPWSRKSVQCLEHAGCTRTRPGGERNCSGWMDGTASGTWKVDLASGAALGDPSPQDAGLAQHLQNEQNLRDSYQDRPTYLRRTPSMPGLCFLFSPSGGLAMHESGMSLASPPVPSSPP